MKRLAAVFAALLIVAALLASCENVTLEHESSQEESSRDPYKDIESMLPPEIEESEGFSGTQTITVITGEPQLFISYEETPTAYRTHLSERNAYLSRRYGIELAAVKKSGAEALNEIKEASLSGAECGEILAFSTEDTLKLWAEGLLYDLNELPGFDPASSAYDEKNALALATNKTLYMLPDPSCYWFEEIYVMFCNTDLLSESLAGPVQLAARGEWTWDAFTEHCKEAYAVSKGRFGFGSYSEVETYANVMWISSGKKLVGNTYKNNIALSLPVEEISDTARTLKSHYDTYYRYPETKASAAQQFENGGLIFITNKLSYLYSLRDGSEAGLNFVLLPMPKLDAAQDGYSCLVSEGARVYSVPVTVKNADAQTLARINAFLAVACASGGPAAKKAFVGTTLANHLTANDETLALQAAVDGATFDFSNAYGTKAWELSYCTTKVISDYIGFGSEVANSIYHAQGNFERYVNEKFNN